jgi:hypothetical protein
VPLQEREKRSRVILTESKVKMIQVVLRRAERGAWKVGDEMEQRKNEKGGNSYQSIFDGDHCRNSTYLAYRNSEKAAGEMAWPPKDRSADWPKALPSPQRITIFQRVQPYLDVRPHPRVGHWPKNKSRSRF